VWPRGPHIHLGALTAAGALYCALALAPPAHAQPAADQPARPRDLPLMPDDALRAPPVAPLLLPAPAAGQAQPGLSGTPRLTLRAVRFRGNTVFAEAVLQALVTGFVGRSIGADELEALRLRVTRQYIEAGYINSGAVIPDQEIDDGVLLVLVVEGRLSEVELVGSNRFRAPYLQQRLARGAGTVLNVNGLQEQMQLLLQDPQIERLSAELAPGAVPGEARLRVDVTSAPLFIAGASYGNDRSPAVGADQADGHVGVRNLFGVGDTFTLRAANTQGLEDGAFSFSVPVHASGTLLQIRATHTRSRIIEAPLDQLDIRARASGVELAVSQPLLTRLTHSLTGTLTVSNRRTRNFIFGEPSPFIPGAPDGVSTVSALRAGLEWVSRSPQRVVALRGLVSTGLDAFGASVATAPGVADSRFTTVLAQGQWIERAGANGTLLMRFENQQASDALLGPERYALGGADSVRGYRKDVLIRDTGWFTSLEYRHRVAELRLPTGRTAQPGEGAIQLAVFADAGRGRLRNEPTPAPSLLSSIGAGVRWEPLAGVQAQLYYGSAIHPVQTPTNTLADRGWHFRLAWQTAF
jgi:hemolysin activation/secretion protein